MQQQLQQEHHNNFWLYAFIIIVIAVLTFLYVKNRFPKNEFEKKQDSFQDLGERRTQMMQDIPQLTDEEKKSVLEELESRREKGVTVDSEGNETVIPDLSLEEKKKLLEALNSQRQ